MPRAIAGIALASALIAGVVQPAAAYTPPTVQDQAATIDSYDFLAVQAPGVLTGATEFNPFDTLVTFEVDPPKHGTLQFGGDGSYVYQSDAGFVGVDSFTFYAADALDPSNVGTVTITVEGAPNAVDDSYVTAQDTPLTVDGPNGLQMNDSDLESDPLSSNVDQSTVNGSLAVNGDGSFTYSPNAGFSGSDSATYYDFDLNGRGSDATITFSVTAAPSPNAAPVATDDAYAIDPNGPTVSAVDGVLANDTDAESDSLTAILTIGVQHGQLVLAADGSFTYQVDAGYAGDDSFSYQANDGTNLSAIATVTLTGQGPVSSPSPTPSPSPTSTPTVDPSPTTAPSPSSTPAIEPSPTPTSTPDARDPGSKVTKLPDTGVGRDHPTDKHLERIETLILGSTLLTGLAIARRFRRRNQ